jgi:hypothetical protein
MAAMDSSTATTPTKINTIPKWKASGDWFDVCRCTIPCPCEFAQAPTYEECDGILAYHIKKGNYGDIPLDGLNVLVIASFKGNIWAGDGLTKTIMAIFFDDKSDEKQRKALNMIFSGKAGGFMAQFAKLVGEIRGIEYALLSLRLQMTCLIGVQKYRVKS